MQGDVVTRKKQPIFFPYHLDHSPILNVEEKDLGVIISIIFFGVPIFIISPPKESREQLTKNHQL